MLPALNGRRFVRNWARTLAGQRVLEELLDFGYRLDPPPVSGGARNFDPINDISRADNALLDVADSDSMILQMLVKLDAVAAVVRQMGGKVVGSGLNGYGLLMDDSEVPFFKVNDGTDNVNRLGTTMTAGTWYAFTCVLKAIAAANDDISLWQDFTQNGPTNSTVMGTLVNGDPFRVGADGSASPGTAWDGDVAYCRFWKKVAAAWTDAEIALVVQAQNRLVLPAGWGPGSMNLQWVLWDTAASPGTTKDLSGNGLDGTYTGTTFVDDPRRVMGPGGGLVMAQRVPAPVGAVSSWRRMTRYGV